MNRQKARKRAEELVAKMTLEEKASQLSYNAPAIERLQIPAYNWWNEALHGVARAGTATVFPQAIGLGATFDEGLLQEIGDAVATEGRAKYNASVKQGDYDIYKGLTFWSPNVNLFRDPRWGRGHETYGEDPYLSGRMGAAYIRGMQGDGEVMKAAACAKHFAVHSGPEALRHEFNAEVSKKDLRESYLPAFEETVCEAGVEGVMGAYNRVNGEPCCASRTLMKEILRGEWGFEGYYVSDCGAIRDFYENHHVTPDAKSAAALALKNGCDLNCGQTYLHLLDAFRHGMVTEEEITEAAVRLFTTRFLLGLFDQNEYSEIPYTAVECREHLELAERAAAESMVLLKNDGILPLDRKNIRTIGVIGPNADSRKALIGNYHGTSSEYITVLEGIRRAAGDTIRILYSEGASLNAECAEPMALADDRLSEAAAVAENSDAVILCVGLDETLEGEEGDSGNAYFSGDKADLQLPESQRRLLERIARIEVPVVLCLMAGSAIDLKFAREHFAGILQLWYPGARGGKVFGEVLFGDKQPSGKLCVTFYEEEKYLPDMQDYSMKGRTYRYADGNVQYPFGYGLTYGDVKVTAAAYDREENCIAARVKNEGIYPAQDVVQVYCKNMTSEFAPLNPRLCGFGRVTLQPGESAEINIFLDKRVFMVVNEEGEYITDGTDYCLYVGCSQPDELSVSLTGKNPVIRIIGQE